MPDLHHPPVAETTSESPALLITETVPVGPLPWTCSILGWLSVAAKCHVWTINHVLCQSSWRSIEHLKNNNNNKTIVWINVSGNERTLKTKQNKKWSRNLWCVGRKQPSEAFGMSSLETSLSVDNTWTRREGSQDADPEQIWAYHASELGILAAISSERGVVFPQVSFSSFFFSFYTSLFCVMWLCHSVRVKVGGQLIGICTCFPPCVSQG